jgi:hypothetical protein
MAISPHAFTDFFYCPEESKTSYYVNPDIRILKSCTKFPCQMGANWSKSLENIYVFGTKANPVTELASQGFGWEMLA